MPRPINTFDVDLARSKGTVETRRIRLVAPLVGSSADELVAQARIAAIQSFRADNGLSTNVTVLAFNVRLVTIEQPSSV